MTYVALLYLAFVLVIGLWAWGQRPTGWRAHVSVGALPLFYLAFLLSGLEILSRPKPMPMAWFESLQADEDTSVEVLGSKTEQGEAIYVWLALPDTDAPRAYRLPWSREQAQQLHEAEKRAEGNKGARVMMRAPFDNRRRTDDGVETDRMFYAEPQPPGPPKGGME